MRILMLLPIVAGLAVVLFKPLFAFGEQRVGPGGGDLLNGGVGMILLLVLPLIVALAIRRSRNAAKDRP